MLEPNKEKVWVKVGTRSGRVEGSEGQDSKAQSTRREKSQTELWLQMGWRWGVCRKPKKLLHL